MRWPRNKPINNASVNFAHPMAKGLVTCYLMNGLTPRNLLFPETLTSITGSPTKTGSSKFGSGIGFSGSEKIRITSSKNFCNSSPSTVMLGVRFNTYDKAAINLFGGISFSYLTDNDRMRCSWYYWGGGWQSMDCIWIDRRKKDYLLMFRYGNTGGSYFDFRTGLGDGWMGDDGYSTSSTGESAPTFQNSYIDFGADTSNNASLDGNIYFLYVWNRTLSKKDYARILQDPYQFISTPNTRKRFTSVAGGSSPYSGKRRIRLG